MRYILDNLGYVESISCNQFQCEGTSRNLFDKNNVKKITGYSGGGGTIIEGSTGKILYIPCMSNTTYTIQKIVSNRFVISTSTDVPAVGTAITRLFAGGGTQQTVTTNNTAKYLIVDYFDNESNEQSILNSIQIEVGSVATAYVPFGIVEKSCKEYTGTIPEGYSSLEGWAATANIRAFKIVNGNLTYDGTRAAELEEEWAQNGWQTATLTSKFATYATGYEPRYKKQGIFVEIQGVVKPTEVLTNGGSEANIFVLPVGFRPKIGLQFVCQGSGSNRWLLTVNPGGTVNISRYGTTSFIDVPVGAWLPFNVLFMID
jgi:hypothetical protein